jgi:hypothetical protein
MRPVGRPPNEVRRYYANFTYQAASWTPAASDQKEISGGRLATSPASTT